MGYECFNNRDNGRWAQYTLRSLFEYSAQIAGSDVIHWNNGLWDVCDLFGDGPFTPLDEYVANMLRIADILLGTSKKVIFATTTPTHPDMPGHDVERTRLYNETLVPLLRKKGIVINDLFSLMLPHRLDGLRDDMIHLNDLGKELCSRQVAECIRSQLSCPGPRQTHRQSKPGISLRSEKTV